jgi:hypothetical protein
LIFALCLLLFPFDFARGAPFDRLSVPSPAERDRGMSNVEARFRSCFPPLPADCLLLTAIRLLPTHPRRGSD